MTTLPSCRCWSCDKLFDQPHHYWFSRDCPACEKKRAPCECHHAKAQHPRGSACLTRGCACEKYDDRKLVEKAGGLS